MKKYKIKSHEVELQLYESRIDDVCTLLFLHGGPGSGAWPMILHEAMQTLQQRHHCVFFDQRGCGLSRYDISKGINFHDMLEDVNRIAMDIKAKTNKPLLLCGESFGGTLAMQCVDIFPDLFDGLILSSTVMISNREDALRIFTLLKKEYIKRTNDKARKIITILDALSPEEFFQHPQIQQLIFSCEPFSTCLQHLAAMSSWLFQISCEEILHRLTIPTLMMQGSKDCIAMEGNIIDILVRLKNPFILYESFPEIGHEISVDDPISFVERIERFLHDEFVCQS